MQALQTTLTTALLVSAMVGFASAQDVRGFVTGGLVSDVNKQRHPAASGGVIVDLGQPWLGLGAQAETFWSWPYFGGRVALFGQGTFIPKGPVRPFALLGRGWGEMTGMLLVGGGVEIRPSKQRLGLRVAVEDYPARLKGINCVWYGIPQSECDARGYSKDRVEHQIALRVGLLF